MKTSTKYVIAGIAVVATAGAAFAAQGYRHHGDRARMAMEMFNKADADGDKAISLAEMMAALTARFDKADGNGDKSVTKAEVIAAVEGDPQMSRAKRWSGRIADNVVYRLDLDDNGSVAFTEVENRAKKLFALLDRNDDGKLELAELRRDMGGMRGHHRQGKGRWWGGDDAGGDAAEKPAE
ncbi:MAG: hypothetical protein KDJ67_07630 [Nitratireductor sp.]|nr:hypothetical protein [Nitratireductor sp.]